MADKKYEEHMMYGDGKARKAETKAEHLELKNKGWGHKKPSGFKMKGYTYPGMSPIKAKAKGMDGKACWEGYSLRGTKMKGGKRVDNCVKN
tara:strand:- start:49 stop:321 length:273 start_codon:yes stop_codon:yes gene_type:complete